MLLAYNNLTEWTIVIFLFELNFATPYLSNALWIIQFGWKMTSFCPFVNLVYLEYCKRCIIVDLNKKKFILFKGALCLHCLPKKQTQYNNKLH